MCTNLTKSLLAGVLIAGIFNGCQKGADDLAQNIPSPSIGAAAGAAAANYVSNELLVKFK